MKSQPQVSLLLNHWKQQNKHYWKVLEEKIWIAREGTISPIMAASTESSSSSRRGYNSGDSILHNGKQSSKDYKTVTLNQKDRDCGILLATPSRRFCYRQKGNVYDHLAYLSYLCLGSYIGVICRIYLSELAHWDGVPLFGSLYSQLVGTMIMGFTIAHKSTLGEHHAFLYQAITTGVCGSITTFSSWNQEAMATLLQTGYDQPDNAARIFGWATILLLGLGMSSGALGVGQHLASLSPWSDARVQVREPVSTDFTPQAGQYCCRVCISPGSKCWSILSMCVWLVLCSISTTTVGVLMNRWDFVFSILLAGLGTYCRWHLAPLNALIPGFKLGTFCVNVVGAWLLGGVLILQDFYSSSRWAHDVLVGMATGFCGCLTTVSTFSVELSGMQVKHAYMYAIASILMAQIGLLAIQGPVQWTSHLRK